MLLFLTISFVFINLSMYAKEPLQAVDRKEKNHNLSICAIFKNEAKFLKEWIEYHRLVGVDHFYLYDNGSTDRFKEILNPYIKDKTVTLIYWPERADDTSEEKAFAWALSTQVPAYENAVKFRAARSPTITIEAYETDQEIRLSVADNGIGIDAKFADKIFEMFYRLHDDEEYEGTGIGLAVCRKIINDHAGRIWLDTDHVCGTKFVCALRAASSNDLADAASTPRIRRDGNRVPDSDISIAPAPVA